jgi:hypothetical protein
VRDRIDGDVGAVSLEAGMGRVRDEVQQRLVRQTVQMTGASWSDSNVAHEY